MGRRKNELTHLYRDHLRVYSKVKPAPQLSHCPSAGRWNAEQDGGGELFPPFHDSILLDLFILSAFSLCSRNLSPAPLLLPGPASQSPLPHSPCLPSPHCLRALGLGIWGPKLLPHVPFSSSSRAPQAVWGGGSEKALNHRRIWKWWKRAGWCWKPEVGICPDAARGQECGH